MIDALIFVGMATLIVIMIAIVSFVLFIFFYAY